jgi:hypothetical protein
MDDSQFDITKLRKKGKKEKEKEKKPLERTIAEYGPPVTRLFEPSILLLLLLLYWGRNDGG